LEQQAFSQCHIEAGLHPGIRQLKYSGICSARPKEYLFSGKKAHRYKPAYRQNLSFCTFLKNCGIPCTPAKILLCCRRWNNSGKGQFPYFLPG
jgi:hypothetical protein